MSGNSEHEVILIESQDPDESPADHLVEQNGGAGVIGVDVVPQLQDAGGSRGVGAAARSGERRKPTSAAGDAKQVPEEEEEEESIQILEGARRYLHSEEEEAESDGDGDGGSDFGEGFGSRKRKGVTNCQSCEIVEPRRMYLPHVLWSAANKVARSSGCLAHNFEAYASVPDAKKMLDSGLRM